MHSNGYTKRFGLAAILSATAVLGLAPISASAQTVGTDVPEGHWAYQAIRDLASKGLIQGYPANNDFLGGRTLTRYEMANLIDRVLKYVEGAAAKSSAGLSSDEAGKLKANLDEIRQLTNDFKAQLAVIGTDLDKAKAAMDSIDRLNLKVTDLSNRADGIDTKIGALTKSVNDNAVLTDQALENIKQVKEALPGQLAKKVDVGVGKLRVAGLLQEWYGTSFGDTFSGMTTANPSPPGRTFGINGGANDSFRIRRGEIILVGNVTKNVDFKANFNIANTGTGASAPMLDCFVGYQLTKRLRAEIGQQKTGLSEEGTRSSGQLLTVARSIMSENLPATDGRIGNEYDTGLAIRYASGPISAFMGIWNDNGGRQSQTDNNSQKFIDGSIYYVGLRHFTFGIWGGTNAGNTKPVETLDRAGFTVIWQSGPHYFETEGAYARDYAAAVPGPGLNGAVSWGGYALYAHSLSKQWQLVTRYDVFDPAHLKDDAQVPATTVSGITIPLADHKLHEYTFGFNYYLLKHNAKIQVNYIRVDTERNGEAYFGKQRSILLTNYQVSF